MKRKLSKNYVDRAEYPGLPLDSLKEQLRDGEITKAQFEERREELLESCQYLDKNGRVQWKPCLIYDTHQDAPKGLALRISAHGTKTFVVYYRVGGQRRMLSLGEYGDSVLERKNREEDVVPLTLDKARKLAEVPRGKAREGKDAVQEKQDKRQAKRDEKQKELAAQGFTFEKLAEDYLEDARGNGRRSWPEEERQLKKDVYPLIGDKSVAEVNADNVDDCLDRILNRASKPRKATRGVGKQSRSTKKGGKVAANRLRTCLVSVFNFGLRNRKWRKVVQLNPALLTERPLKKERSKQNLRKVHLENSDQIRRFWHALDEGFHPVIVASLRLRLLLGTRRGETHQMLWDDRGVQEAQHSGGTVQIPYIKIRGKTTKNGLDLIMPLSSPALAVLGELKPVTGDSDWLFPLIRMPKERDPNKPPVVGDLAPATKRAAKMAELPSDFTGHDLRRTLISLMPLQGIRDEVISRVIGHSVDGITEDYNQWDYLAERYEALKKWGDWIERIVTSNDEDNVIEMAYRRYRAGSPTTA